MAVEPLDVPAVVAPPKVSLSVRPTPLETGYRPVEKARSSPGWISWQREAARFGMLTEPHPLVGYDANSPLGRFCQAHPEWRDLYFDLGHYLAYDSGTPLAAEILGESFRHYFGHTFPNSGTDYCELAREPGVENCNARTRNEMAAVRKAVPGVPVTVDVRGHHAYTDGYMAYDPEAIASLEDIFHVHCGFFAYEYNNTPVHVPTLCDATAYPLFAYNYFVRNTTKPVVQSEDIISCAGLPGSDGEAMAENDMARDSPLTEGVAKVNLFTLSPLVAHKGPDVVPVVRIPATADNAALLENVVGWLLRERVTPEMRATFKANLFVTKEAMA